MVDLQKQNEPSNIQLKTLMNIWWYVKSIAACIRIYVPIYGLYIYRKNLYENWYTINLWLSFWPSKQPYTTQQFNFNLFKWINKQANAIHVFWGKSEQFYMFLSILHSFISSALVLFNGGFVVWWFPATFMYANLEWNEQKLGHWCISNKILDFFSA